MATASDKNTTSSNSNDYVSFGTKIPPPVPSSRNALPPLNQNPGLPQHSTGLTGAELARLRALLNAHSSFDDDRTMESNYEEFQESTHAWAVFADDPQTPATKMDRAVGVLIICFQLYTYSIFVWEAIEDYGDGKIPVWVDKDDCEGANEEPAENFICEANETNHLDAFIAFCMLGIFLSGDFLQASRAIRNAPHFYGLLFASLAGVEVVSAYLSATIAVSYNLYIGEVTDAIEVGVGLLFIRELSSRAYHGISGKKKKKKEYVSFFVVLFVLVTIGLCMDPLCQKLYAA